MYGKCFLIKIEFLGKQQRLNEGILSVIVRARVTVELMIIKFF